MVTSSVIQEISNEIVQKFLPDQIILFGSYANGTSHEGSDVDLLVILPFEGRSFHKSLEIAKNIHRPVGIDLLARTPEDTQRRYREGDPLIREALDKGIILYDRTRQRVAS